MRTHTTTTNVGHYPTAKKVVSINNNRGGVAFDSSCAPSKNQMKFSYALRLRHLIQTVTQLCNYQHEPDWCRKIKRNPLCSAGGGKTTYKLIKFQNEVLNPVNETIVGWVAGTPPLILWQVDQLLEIVEPDRRIKTFEESNLCLIPSRGGLCYPSSICRNSQEVTSVEKKLTNFM